MIKITLIILTFMSFVGFVAWLIYIKIWNTMTLVMQGVCPKCKCNMVWNDQDSTYHCLNCGNEARVKNDR